jgi:adsorption protein B
MVIHGFDGAVRGLTAFSAVAILVSGLDDLFIDVCYYASEMFRKTHRARFPPVTEAELRALPEQSVAIMIPAWHEDAVIAHMLRNTLGTLDYKNFEIFVGTYPNDEATMLAVAGVAESDPRVHRIVCPHDGPTNKADCMNWIIEGIRHYDKTTGKRISIFVLHDSEDMVHPLSLKLMNRYLPGVSMVQLPVIPFESKASEMTAGTYLDEFAESHVKDMVVRERISGMVPSAGVGTGFARDAIDRLAKKHDNQIFNVATFTEDYDLAFRMNAIGERSVLVQFYVERTKAAPSGKLKVVRELVGTRGYFPSNFGDAVRQKARWTLGIVFHGWQQRGWEGGPALRYMIWRDRKALLTNAVNILGYLLLLVAAAHSRLAHAGFARGLEPIPSGSWVWKVIIVDGLLLVNRCVQRVVCLRAISNWKQAALCLPRIIWGNVINFCAVAKASHIFIRTSLTGKKPVWAKTAHAFPTEAQLMGYKRKLGDLLLESHLVTLARLGEALTVQKEKGGLLGEVLVDLGYVSETALVETLAAQLKVEARRLDSATAPQSEDLIMEAACREHLMVVVDPESRPVVIAAAVLGDARMKKWLDANFPHPYRLVLAGRRNIVDVVERASAERRRAAYPPLPSSADRPQTDRLQ